MLRKTEYKASTALVTLLTEDMGLIQVRAYGAHSAKNGIASGIQSFSYGEFSLTEKNGAYTMRTAELIESFGKLSATYDEILSATRLVRAALRIFGDAANHSAFLLLYYCMSFMSYSDMHFDDVYIYFLLHAMSLSGQRPAITDCAVCGDSLYLHGNINFSNRSGGAVCQECASGVPVSHLALEAMRRMLDIPPEEMKKIRLPQQVRTELLSLMTGYYSFWYD